MNKSEKYFLDKLPEVYQAEVLDNISYLILAHTFNPISSIDIVERCGALIKDINELYLEKYCEYDLSVRDRCITIFIVHHILSNLDYWCTYPQFSKLEYEYTKPLRQHYILIDKKEINKCIMKYKNYIFNTMMLWVINVMALTVLRSNNVYCIFRSRTNCQYIEARKTIIYYIFLGWL